MVQRYNGKKGHFVHRSLGEGVEAKRRYGVRIFPSPYELAEKFAGELVDMINAAAKENIQVTIALSGGSTPELLFSILGDHFSNSAKWEFVHFFWGDERCVAPENPESNFGMTWKKFLGKTGIPDCNIHRIMGEDLPEEEAVRYSGEISRYTPGRDGLPVFDLIILGLGDDGHTASIFPDNLKLLNGTGICSTAIHPVTHQCRITLTGKVINNAASVVFLVTGIKKAGIVEKILNKKPEAVNFPASYIVPVHGDLNWYLDVDAASLLTN